MPIAREGASRGASRTVLALLAATLLLGVTVAIPTRARAASNPDDTWAVALERPAARGMARIGAIQIPVQNGHAHPQVELVIEGMEAR